MSRANTRHWAGACVGRPWDAHDNHCRAFCRLVRAERFGLEVPEMPLDAADPRAARRAFACAAERGRWQPVAIPTEG